MKIGIDIRPLMTAPRTGVGEYTYELLNAIFELDRENQYFLFYNSSRDVSANIPDWKFENVKIIGSHMPNKFFNTSLGLFGRPKLDKTIFRCHSRESGNPVASLRGSPIKSGKTSRIDIWYSPNLNFTALSPKTKFILTVHDLSFEFFPEFSTCKHYWCHKFMGVKKQCERAELIITPSENTKRDIMNYYKINPEKIKVIYPGIKQFTVHSSQFTDVEIKQKYNLPDKYILFLGTIEPRKNIIGLIEAFEKMRSTQPHTQHLVIAGAPGWKNEEIFARAKISKYADKIHFINFVAPEDKTALYVAADLFVYPSFYEGFGFPVLEAMAAGTPVITSNRSSLPEITGSSAYLVDPTRPEQIALAMNEILSKQNLRENFIQKGFEQIKKFEWENAGREWVELIK